ncbi:BamA/TamA family outer membrane protein [Pontibacter aydingkolensis]|uniref:BamA/TamA family outer membrane protein n=2 Tax=Pontibacter aydingkolensis TaxID=1911536 RepID=A0ABS7CUG4_9BACT|nr:BamA/TamA family outer membrane protein [Pontibacter aydingkolensis]
MPQKPVSRQVYFTHILVLLAAVYLSACSGTKRIPEGDALFTGFTVKVKGKNDSSNRQSEMETELSATVRPKPSGSILGLRPKLWIYNTFYTEKEKGLKHFIMTKLGSPPVLISQVDTGSVSQVMSNRLHNRGYFNNSVSSAITSKNKKATIQWTANVSEPYRIRKIEYTLNDSLPIHKQIKQAQPESLLKPGEPYDLQNMTNERMRIDGLLKNKGYYHFTPDALIFSVDTMVGNRQVDMLMRLKRDVASRTLKPYTLDDIYIFANYSVGDSLSVSDTLSYKSYHYIPNEDFVRARHLLRNVFLVQDSLYTRQNHLLTLNRLAGLSAYKFSNIDYKIDTLNNDKLDAFIYLTPAFRKSLRVETQMVSKSNGFAGPGVTVSFRNRNAFRGSELLNVDVTANFESQVGGRGTGTTPEGNRQSKQQQGLNSYELGTQVSLTIPRILSPFELPNLRTEFVPKTRIGLGFSFLNRLAFFKMNSYNASYAYNWRPRKTLTHDITPINLQYVRLSNTTEDFEERLAENPYLRRSFENQFIIGSIYQLIYTTQVYPDRTSQVFNSLVLDGSGNMINALNSLRGVDKPTQDAPRTLFGQNYSQYILANNDFRHYFNFGKESQLVARLVTAVGYSYGNSNTLPFVKQFSIGGPNSIRAFRARSVGPGTYNIPDELSFSYFDQTGDVKLETNLEYRFPISGFFKGAVFVDAGNIWLLRDTFDDEGNLNKPGAKFNSKTFLNQLAVGTGFGLRVDVEFFVLRFDLGIPVQVPYLPKGQRNVLSDFDFSFGGETGMVLNIAIGYPF